LTKSELVKLIASRADLTQDRVEEVLDCILETMIGAMREGERIELRGFGAFGVRLRGPRRGRNPRSGTPVAVRPQRWIYFRVGKELRLALNAPRS